MTSPSHDEQLRALEHRVKKIEDFLFPPGGPGVEEQIAALKEGVRRSASALRKELAGLDERKTREIKEIYEIIAHLSKFAPTRHSRGSRIRRMRA